MITIGLINEIKNIQSTCSQDLKLLLNKAIQQGILEDINGNIPFIKEYVEIKPIEYVNNFTVNETESFSKKYESFDGYIDLDKVKVNSWVLIRIKNLDGTFKYVISQVILLTYNCITVDYGYRFDRYGIDLSSPTERPPMSIIGINCSDYYIDYKITKKEILCNKHL